jgi:hypothetical protein
MTLPASGSISLSQVNVELGRASNAKTSLGESAVRSRAGVASRAIGKASLRGKSSYTPMQASGVNAIASGQASSANSGGTAAVNPSVNVAYGSGGYTFQWAYMPGYGTGSSLSNATSQSCAVSKTFAKLSNGSFDEFLQCTITDNTGHTVVVSNIEASASWGTAV